MAGVTRFLETKSPPRSCSLDALGPPLDAEFRPPRGTFLGRVGAPDGEGAVERAGHRTAPHLFHVPVVGEARPAEDRLDGGGPDVAGLDRLDPAEGEHVREVDEPEL